MRQNRLKKRIEKIKRKNFKDISKNILKNKKNKSQPLVIILLML